MRSTCRRIRVRFDEHAAVVKVFPLVMGVLAPRVRRVAVSVCGLPEPKDASACAVASVLCNLVESLEELDLYAPASQREFKTFVTPLLPKFTLLTRLELNGFKVRHVVEQLKTLSHLRRLRYITYTRAT